MDPEEFNAKLDAATAKRKEAYRQLMSSGIGSIGMPAQTIFIRSVIDEHALMRDQLIAITERLRRLEGS